MPERPTGTVTFLFTDIEGSTKLWEHRPEPMRAALARHDHLLRQAIAAYGGYVFKTVGDAFCAAFATAPDALAAALQAQRALAAEPWGETGAIHMRAGLHSGVAEEREGDYFGPAVNRVARLMSAGHGGQILLSQATYELVRDHLPPDVEVRDLGERCLKDLIRPEHIYQVQPPDLPAEFPPLKTLDIRPNNLPAQATPLTGREQELTLLRELVLRPEVRLVTLTGAGGTGKTRLALQVAADVVDDFDNGVYFVELAPITDPTLVAPTIAGTLKVQEQPGRSLLDSLKDYLRDKALLLLLDNFEQVVSAAVIIAELLQAALGLTVLVTSRVALHVRGEQEFPVPPLSAPNPKRLPVPGPNLVSTVSQYAAVELFIQRAVNVKPDFTVSNQNAAAVAEICYRLDGLPLAIELAAARIRILSPHAILQRLDARLKLLVGGARDLPARQQTLRNAIAWSYQLLDAGEQRLFSRLAVFVGGCTLEAVEAVCNADGDLGGDVLDGMESLVANSLLKYDEEIAGEPRFTMLETIREYALETLDRSGQGDAVRHHHAAFCLALVEEAEPKLRGPEQVMWAKRLEMEHDNIRTALGWCATDDPVLGLRLAGTMQPFWSFRGLYSEGRAWLGRLLAHPVNVRPDVRRGRALAGVCLLAFYQGDLAAASSSGEEAYTIAAKLGDKHLTYHALEGLAMVTCVQGDRAQWRRVVEQQLTVANELGDKGLTAGPLWHLGNLAYMAGDLATARAHYEESQALFRAIGDRWGIAFISNLLGNVLMAQGYYVEASARYLEAMAEFEALEQSMWYWLTRANLALALRDSGQLAEARRLLDEVVVYERQRGEKISLPNNLNELAVVVHILGDTQQARVLLGEALALARAIGLQTETALTLVNQAIMAHAARDSAGSQRLSQEGLAALHTGGVGLQLAPALAVVAAVADTADPAQAVRTVRLSSWVTAALEGWGMVLSPYVRSLLDTALADAHTTLSQDAFAEALTQGRSMTLEQAVTYALEEATANYGVSGANAEPRSAGTTLSPGEGPKSDKRS